MADYHPLTIWRIQAPLDAVYAAIHNTPGWMDWWTGVMKVEALAAGDADGINSVLRYVWQGRLPYRMVFDTYAPPASTRWWMNLVAPFARTLFIRNHGRLMRQGAEGLARMLRAPLLSQENFDLKAGITHV